MVQSFPRYIVGTTPRVKGYSPGQPRSRSGSKPGIESGPARGSTSAPETVVKSRFHGGRDAKVFSTAPSQRCRPSWIPTGTVGSARFSSLIDRSPPSRIAESRQGFPIDGLACADRHERCNEVRAAIWPGKEELNDETDHHSSGDSCGRRVRRRVRADGCRNHDQGQVETRRG